VAWLTRGSEVLAALDLDSPWGREPIEHARLVVGPRLVHSLGGQQPVDVAWCRSDSADRLEVRRISVLAPWRVARPCGPRLAVVVAPCGAFERWHLRVGDVLEISGESGNEDHRPGTRAG
jgi:uncharacterized protein